MSSSDLARRSLTTAAAVSTPLPVPPPGLGAPNPGSVDFPDRGASPVDGDAGGPWVGPPAAPGRGEEEECPPPPPPANKGLSWAFSEIDIDTLSAQLDAGSDNGDRGREADANSNADAPAAPPAPPAPPDMHATHAPPLGANGPGSSSDQTVRSLSTVAPFTPGTPPRSAHPSAAEVRKPPRPGALPVATAQGAAPTDEGGGVGGGDDDDGDDGSSRPQSPAAVPPRLAMTAAEIQMLPEGTLKELERRREEERYVARQVSLAKRRAIQYLDSPGGCAAVEYRHELAKSRPLDDTARRRNSSVAASLAEGNIKFVAAELFKLFDLDGDGQFDSQDVRVLVDVLRGAYPDDAVHRAFLEFDSGLKDFWSTADFQRWFASEHLKAADRALLVESLAGADFRSRLETKQQLLQEELTTARAAARARFRDVHPVADGAVSEDLWRAFRAANLQADTAAVPAVAAPIVKERARRAKEVRFVAHACEFTRERLLLVLKTAKGRRVIAEEVGASGGAIRKKVAKLLPPPPPAPSSSSSSSQSPSPAAPLPSSSSSSSARRPHSKRGRALARHFFTLFDVDKNARLDGFELGMLLDDLGQPFTDFELSQLLLEAGVATHGASLSPAEFAAVVLGDFRVSVNLGLTAANLQELVERQGDGSGGDGSGGDSGGPHAADVPPYYLLYVRQMMMMETVASTVARSTQVFREVYPCFVDDADALIEKSGKSPMAQPAMRRASIAKIHALMQRTEDSVGGTGVGAASPRQKRMKGNFRASIVGADMTPFEVLRGTLQKKSRAGAWQPRFFSLNNEYLNYYQSEQDFLDSPVKKLAGTFSLKSLALVEHARGQPPDVVATSGSGGGGAAAAAADGRLVRLLFTDHTSTVLLAESSRAAAMWVEQVDMRRRWFQDLSDAEASSTRMKLHAEARQRQILERQRRRGGSTDEGSGSADNKLLEDIHLEHMAEVVALKKSMAAKLQQQKADFLEEARQLRNGHAEELAAEKQRLEEQRARAVAAAQAQGTEALAAAAEQHESQTAALRASLHATAEDRSAAAQVCDALQEDNRRQAEALQRHEHQLRRQQDEIQALRLAAVEARAALHRVVEAKEASEARLRDCERELLPLRKEAAALSEVVANYPKERSTLAQQLLECDDKHRAELASAVAALRVQHNHEVVRFCQSQTAAMARGHPGNGGVPDTGAARRGGGGGGGRGGAVVRSTPAAGFLPRSPAPWTRAVCTATAAAVAAAITPTPSATERAAARTICTFLRRAAARQAARERRRRVFGSKVGRCWYRVVRSELRRQLARHTQSRAVATAVYAVLQRHFLSYEQFEAVCRGVDEGGRGVRVFSVAKQAEALYLRSVRRNYRHAQALMRAGVGASSGAESGGSTLNRCSTGGHRHHLDHHHHHHRSRADYGSQRRHRHRQGDGDARAVPVDDDVVARSARAVALGFVVRHHLCARLRAGDSVDEAAFRAVAASAP